MKVEDIKSLKSEALAALENVNSTDSLEQFRLEYLVKKGKIQAVTDKMREVPKEDKPVFGKELNLMKKAINEAFESKKESLEQQESTSPDFDLSLPGRRKKSRGSFHPVMETLRQMISIFESMGFSVAEGPEIEDEFHNFDALNFPKDHPARDMQDTFFMKSDKSVLLRTHTSPVQIRLMQSKNPPIRSIMPGRVYRNESIDSTHLAEFHQLEGLYVDKNVSLAELKATMIHFAKQMYGNDLEARFRPSFFPFTEPSAELDISKDGGKSWMEVGGCGMVHPNVLRSGGIDPEEYTGYAFGIGIERVTMLRTKLDDIRALYENDIRVLNQF